MPSNAIPKMQYEANYSFSDGKTAPKLDLLVDTPSTGQGPGGLATDRCRVVPHVMANMIMDNGPGDLLALCNLGRPITELNGANKVSVSTNQHPWGTARTESDLLIPQKTADQVSGVSLMVRKLKPLHGKWRVLKGLKFNLHLSLQHTNVSVEKTVVASMYRSL